MILVFGQSGQVASELQSHKNVIALGRDQANLSIPTTCEEAICRYKPRAVINAAAYTAVDKAESEEGLANTINGDAPAVSHSCTSLLTMYLMALVQRHGLSQTSQTQKMLMGEVSSKESKR